jgi:glycosyltransferase involved in cell wall biosynthesis
MIAATPFFADRGCHVRIYEETKALARRGHEVSLCTYHHGRDLPGLRIVRSPRVPWYRKLEAGPSYHKFYVDLLLVRTALAVGRRERPDVIHAHLHEGAAIGLALRPWLRAPVVLDYQGSLSRELVDHEFVPDGSVRMKAYAAVERWIERSVDAVIVSASSSIERVRVNRGSGDATWVVSDAVDTTPPADPASRLEVRRRLGIPEDRLVVIFMGLLNRYQGLEHLFEAVPLVRCEVPEAHFLVVGFPEEEPARRAREAGLASAMTFTGKVPYEQTPAVLAAADVAVSPKVSLTEANLKLYSYMGAGLPTVVFDNPVNREVLGELGVYARRGDSRDFARALVELLRDPERRRELGRRLREKATAERGWDFQAERLEEVYAAAEANYRRNRTGNGA